MVNHSITRRFLPPAAVSVAIAVLTTIAHQFADGRTDQIICVLYGIASLILTLSVWWLAFSGFTLRTRLVVCFTIVATATSLAATSVRSIWFDGDIRPHIVFRWSPPSPAERSREWLKTNAPPQPNSSATHHQAPNTDTTNLPTKLQITDTDWPRYCGLNSDRKINAPLPSLDWTNSPPRELWRRPVGEAWSSMAIVDSRLWTQEQRGELECVVCYNTATGEELWRREDPARYQTALGAAGPRATPTVSSTAVFSLGATGILNALEPTTGKLIWQRQICSDAKSNMLEWGMSGSPLLFENLVIVDAGGSHGHALAAYDQTSGKPVWTVGSHTAGYTAPRLEFINGQTQLLVFHGDGLEAHNPHTGESLWFYPWTNQYKINVAQPIRFDNLIFLSSGYNAGCVLLDPGNLQNRRPREIWPPTRSLKLKFNEAVPYNQYVYGLDDGILACIDSTTGKRLWKGGRYRFGHVLLWHDKLLIQAEDGAVALVDASPDAFREITRFQPLNDRTWNVPAVAHGKLFVRNAAEMACFSLPQTTIPAPSSSAKNNASIHSLPSAESSDAPAESSNSSASQEPRTDDASPEPSKLL
jgi:outer membrane protein assembly factor BamB